MAIFDSLFRRKKQDVKKSPELVMKAEELIRDGLLSIKENGIDSSLAKWQQAIAIDHTNAEASFLVGCGLYAKGQDSNALEEFRRCIKLEPGRVEAQFYIGMLISENSIDEYKTRFSGPYTLETALKRTGGYDEALNAFGTAHFLASKHSIKAVEGHLETFYLTLMVDARARCRHCCCTQSSQSTNSVFIGS